MAKFIIIKYLLALMLILVISIINNKALNYENNTYYITNNTIDNIKYINNFYYKDIYYKSNSTFNRYLYENSNTTYNYGNNCTYNDSDNKEFLKESYCDKIKRENEEAKYLTDMELYDVENIKAYYNYKNYILNSTLNSTILKEYKDNTKSNNTLKIALIDSGNNYSYNKATCLKANINIKNEYKKIIDYANKNNNNSNKLENYNYNVFIDNDDSGHGSYLVELICGKMGILKDLTNVELYMIKVFNLIDEEIYSKYLFNSLKLVKLLNINVLNLSIGSINFLDKQIQLELINLSNNNVIITVSSGNDGPSYGTINFPSSLINVLAIGSVKIENIYKIKDKSSRGPAIINKYYSLNYKPETYSLPISISHLYKLISKDQYNLKIHTNIIGSSVSSAIAFSFISLILAKLKINRITYNFNINEIKLIIKYSNDLIYNNDNILHEYPSGLLNPKRFYIKTIEYLSYKKTKYNSTYEFLNDDYNIKINNLFYFKNDRIFNYSLKHIIENTNNIFESNIKIDNKKDNYFYIKNILNNINSSIIILNNIIDFTNTFYSNNSKETFNKEKNLKNYIKNNKHINIKYKETKFYYSMQFNEIVSFQLIDINNNHINIDNLSLKFIEFHNSNLIPILDKKCSNVTISKDTKTINNNNTSIITLLLELNINNNTKCKEINKETIVDLYLFLYFKSSNDEQISLFIPIHIKYNLIPIPNKSKRILIDKSKNLIYPFDGYVIKDNLYRNNYLYDWNHDSVNSNYAQLSNYLKFQNYLIEESNYQTILNKSILKYYSMLLIIDTEKDYTNKEIDIIKSNLIESKLSIFIISNWNDKRITDLIDKNIYNTERSNTIIPGSNILSLDPVLNLYNVSIGNNSISDNISFSIFDSFSFYNYLKDNKKYYSSIYNNIISNNNKTNLYRYAKENNLVFNKKFIVSSAGYINQFPKNGYLFGLNNIQFDYNKITNNKSSVVEAFDNENKIPLLGIYLKNTVI